MLKYHWYYDPSEKCCALAFTGESSFQRCLGGEGFRPPASSQQKHVDGIEKTSKLLQKCFDSVAVTCFFHDSDKNPVRDQIGYVPPRSPAALHSKLDSTVILLTVLRLVDTEPKSP